METNTRMNQEYHFKYSVGDRVVENRSKAIGTIAEQMKLGRWIGSKDEWEHTYAVRWDSEPERIDRAGWFEWALAEPNYTDIEVEWYDTLRKWRQILDVH